ncbi:hypothetical protein ACIBH1_31795 [Nonomuraea sp. NPDC050663]|uniref:hypothetical protein n=1 Tax=Nonomuraea sp. NPDC050663 TaxID=3364370 RepID=UPI0037A39E02
MALALLLQDGGDAASACRSVLLAGGTFQVYEGAVSVGSLFSTYRRRERLTRTKGVDSLGFASAVALLEACEFEQVLVGYVQGGEPPYHFQVFLAPDATRLVACLGVPLARRRTE